MTADQGFFMLAKADPAKDGIAAFHTVPPAGEYPSTIQLKDGTSKPGILVVDDLAFEKIMANFQAQAARPEFAGILVDKEHLSELSENSDTIAAAWAKTMERRPDGLWTGWQITPLGEALINGGEYKFRSPVLNLEPIPGSDSRYRPVALMSIGLTNKPRFKQLAPSMNKEDGATGDQQVAPKEKAMPLIERLRAMLKAPPEMSEDDICGKLEAALASAAELPQVKAKVDEFTAAALERDASEFVAKHKALVSDEPKLKALFKADRKAAEEFVAIIKPAPAPAPARVLNREDGKTPARDITAQEEAAKSKAKDQTELCNQIRARAEYRESEFSVIWAVAQREKPELFK